MFTNGIVNVLLSWLSRIIHFEKFDENLWSQLFTWNLS